MFNLIPILINYFNRLNIVKKICTQKYIYLLYKYTKNYNSKKSFKSQPKFNIYLTIFTLTYICF